MIISMKQAIQCLQLPDSHECISSLIGLTDHDILIGADTNLYWADRRRSDQAPSLVYSAQDDINQISSLNDGDLVAWVDDSGLLYIADVHELSSFSLELRSAPIQGKTGF